MRRIAVAVIGCGRMGALHARTIAAHPECRLVAVVDTNASRATELAARYGAEALHGPGAVQRISDAVDAVVVATPASTHADLARAALRVGRWCLVEKPLITEISDAAGLDHPLLGVAHIERFNPALPDLAALGVRRLGARRCAPAGERGLDTDVVHDRMIHDLDLACSAADGPLRVVRAVGHADRVEAWLESETGFQAHLYADRCAEAVERRLLLAASSGRTEVDLLRAVAGPDALTRQWSAFVEAIRGRAAYPVDARAGLAAVALAAEVWAHAVGAERTLGGVC